MLSTSILYCNNIEQSNSRPSPPQSSSLQSDDLIQNHHYHHHHRRRYKHHNDDSSTKSNVNPQRYLRTSSNRTQTTTTNRSIDGQSSLSGGFSKNSIVSSSFSTNKTKINNSHRYRVQYLGCNSCDIRSHKPDNGIGAYQKPLLDLYSAIFRRSLANRSLLTLNQVADLSTHGIFIAEKDRFTSSSSSTTSAHHDRIHSRPGSSASNLDCNTTSNQSGSSPSTIVTKVITPLSNILLWAAVRLQHRTHFRTNNSNRMNVKNTKRRQIGVAFVPLSCSEAVLDKNAFITLNSKQKFLLGIPHPPLFVCILQKINSNQRLECHLFVCGTTDDAIHMCNSMDELRQCQSTIGRLQIPAAGQMGKYSYNNNRHHRIPSSSTSSIITRSSTPSQTASEFSILSTTISRPRFSDIEEEDADVEEVVRENDFNDEDDHLCVVLHNGYIHQKETDVKKLIDNYQSQIVDNKNNSRQAMGNKTIQHSATTTTKNNDNNDGQSKIKYSNARIMTNDVNKTAHDADVIDFQRNFLQ
uniref:Uncharacterized protein LOC113791835 n=1 Tax=Dermatophagoides pteronyssinus TaxID=6956 RepID=A0A6P6XW93_DERPT|nr:uncharacterized protein LOC113791835 [Dermatophagoides pteronyssinus]